MNKKISRAFISVSDKTGLIQLAKKLVEQEVEIIASDGTAAHLKASGIATKSVEQVTGFAQVLDGRVVWDDHANKSMHNLCVRRLTQE